MTLNSLQQIQVPFHNQDMGTVSVIESQVSSAFSVPVFQGALNDADESLVDARTLHKVLQVGKVFAAWIKARISEYGFTENQDFKAIFQSRKIGHGRGKIDYHLSLDMAKELAMIEKTDVGRMVRRYFIQCERIAIKSTSRPTTQKALPNCLTIEQQDTIKSFHRELVQTAPKDKQAKLAITLWSAIKSKYGVSYKKVPTEEFAGVVSLMSRVAVDNGVLYGEVLDPEDKQVTINHPSNWQPLIMCALTCSTAWDTLKPMCIQHSSEMAGAMDAFFSVLHVTAKSVARSIGFQPTEVHEPWKAYAVKNHVISVPMHYRGDYVLRLSGKKPELAQLAFKAV